MTTPSSSFENFRLYFILTSPTCGSIGQGVRVLLRRFEFNADSEFCRPQLLPTTVNAKSLYLLCYCKRKY